jgi:hypothetical protein
LKDAVESQKILTRLLKLKDVSVHPDLDKVPKAFPDCRPLDDDYVLPAKAYRILQTEPAAENNRGSPGGTNQQQLVPGPSATPADAGPVQDPKVAGEDTRSAVPAIAPLLGKVLDDVGPFVAVEKLQPPAPEKSNDSTTLPQQSTREEDPEKLRSSEEQTSKSGDMVKLSAAPGMGCMDVDVPADVHSAVFHDEYFSQVLPLDEQDLGGRTLT